LTKDEDVDVFGVNWRTWRQNGKLLVGANKYIAETVIDNFVTEKKWSGGELALAYDWDKYVELWINGVEFNLPFSAAWSAANVGYVTATEPAIKRGSTTAVFDEIGYKVQLFDNGEIIRNANTVDFSKDTTDNGAVGKIVITYEHLAEVTKVDSTRGTIDLKFWRYANPTAAGTGTVSTYEITDYPTDETFKVKDYVVVILQEGLEPGYPGSYYALLDDKGTATTSDDVWGAKYDGAILAANVLSIAPVEQVSVKATNYTRNANAGNKTTLATLTTDASDKYIFDSFYRFGLGDVPNFDGNALLILDSNGRVIGFTGDVAGPAAYKYVYVENIEVITQSLGAPTVRASVYNPITGETPIVYLPVKYENSAYWVTINSVAVPVKTIADTLVGSYLVSDSSDTGVKNLLGWYYYTSADSASTMTLRSNRTSGGVPGYIKAGSIVSDSGPASVYGVGQIDSNGMTRPNPITGGFSIPNDPTSYGPIYTDSKTLFYYRGTKYTGYAAFPANATTIATPPAISGSALAVRGSDKIIDVIHVYRGASVAAATSTFAIIKAMPYDWLTEPGKIKYTVVGSTAAITNAGVYEESDTQEATYHIGEIVLVKQVGTEWEIEDKISVSPNGTFTSDANYTVNFAHPDYEYFTVLGAPVTAAIWTTSVPYLDGYAAKQIDEGNTTFKSKSRPDEGDIVRIVIGPNAFFTPEVKAVVIDSYNAGATNVRTLIKDALDSNSATYPANAGVLWNADGSVGTADLVAGNVAGLAGGVYSDADWKEKDVIPAIQTLLSGITPTPTITVTKPTATPITGSISIEATVKYQVTSTTSITLNLTITNVGVITTPRPTFTAPAELASASPVGKTVGATGLWSERVSGQYDGRLDNESIPAGAYVFALWDASFAPIAIPSLITGYPTRVNSTGALTTQTWTNITVGGYNYVILQP
jgi:hypothetical protein